MEADKVKEVMRKGTPVMFRGFRCFVKEYRLKLCRDATAHLDDKSTFYHSLVLVDAQNDRAFYEAPLSDVDVVIEVK